LETDSPNAGTSGILGSQSLASEPANLTLNSLHLPELTPYQKKYAPNARKNNRRQQLTTHVASEDNFEKMRLKTERENISKEQN
jgi:hypothetical protein